MFIICQPIAVCRAPALSDAKRPTTKMVRSFAACALALADMDGLDSIGHDDLMERIRSDSVVLLDVRPRDDFASGHLPGAIHIDTTDLEAQVTRLPKDREVVAYCRGPYCVMSYKAVQILRGRVFSVRRLDDGFPEWKAAGRPVETA